MELKMKRLTTAATVFGISILSVWVVFQLFTASQHQVKNTNAPALLANNQVMKAVDSGNKAVIPAPIEAKKVAPVFDSSGALVSDPTGALANASGAIPVTGRDMNVAPVFDANGMMVSNPSGTILNAASSGLVAPVFDASGRVVSDPSGTILNSSHP
jgi:hypothetical protein